MTEKRETLPTLWEISDDLWEQIHPVILEMDPPKSTGRKRVDPRRILDGIIFRMRTGCHWNRLPGELGDDSTIHRTFQRWVRLGVLERIWAVLIEECAELGAVEWQAADCAMGKAGRKRSVLVDGSEGPLSVVAGANVHDTKLLAATLESVVVEAPHGGDAEAKHLCLDKGYDNPTGRQAVAAHGYLGHIRRISEEKLDAQGVETLSGSPLGGGAHLGLVIQVPGNLGALRQEGIQLPGPDPVGVRSALVPAPTATKF